MATCAARLAMLCLATDFTYLVYQKCSDATNTQRQSWTFGHLRQKQRQKLHGVTHARFTIVQSEKRSVALIQLKARCPCGLLKAPQQARHTQHTCECMDLSGATFSMSICEVLHWSSSVACMNVHMSLQWRGYAQAPPGGSLLQPRNTATVTASACLQSKSEFTEPYSQEGIVYS